MKILTFPTRIAWEWHLVCELEIIDTFSQRDNDFTACILPYDDIAVELRGTQDFSENCSWAHFWRKKWYYSKLKNTYNKLDHSIPQKALDRPKLPESFKKWTLVKLRSASNLKDLTKCEYDGVPVGAAAISSFTHLHRRTEVSLQDYEAELEAYFHCAYIVYLVAKNVIEIERPDAVMFFNGRFASQRGIFHAAQEAGVKTLIHERGASFHHYEIFKNGLIHDREQFKVRLENWVSMQSEKDIQSSGHLFFKDRRRGDAQIWKNYLEDQQAGSLPEGMDSKKKNISIFLSSEDEFFSIGEEWENPFFETQYDGVRSLLEEISADVYYWIRLHPNLKEVPPEELDKWYELEKIFPNASIIKPDSNIDSYMLMQNSDKVISFGSTIGLEATYWRKPSILLGVCFYKGLNAVYEPESLSEAKMLIVNEQLAPKEIENTLSYGAYFKSYGTPLVNATALNYFFAKYKGQQMRSNPIYSILAWGPEKVFKRIINKLRAQG